MIEELVRKNRSCRRFRQEYPLAGEILRRLVNLARLCASSANRQPLKYILSCEKKKNSAIFQTLSWAGYLAEWPGPEEGERPSGYIIILGDTDIAKTFGCDHGIAAQSILLGAVEQGLAGCIIVAIDKQSLRDNLAISARYEILLVIALGAPKEKIVLEEVGPSGDIKYWRDKEEVHHVPKRSLEELILDL